MEDIIKNEESLSEWQIKNIHAIILKKNDSDNAGVYRRENVVISGAEHVPPDHKIVSDQMQRLIEDYENKWQSLHHVERASLIHLEFVRIHPFVDGNGRTARLLHNFELMKHGYPPIIIKKEQRLDYYNYLDKAYTKGEIEDFFIFCNTRINESLDLHLYFIEESGS